MNILLIEDDSILADGLKHTLSDVGYSVTVTRSGKSVEPLLQAQDFDLLLLDLGLPDMDGLELLRKLRKKKVALPIFILTARDEVNDRIEGIRQGADDYMTKPFELKELEARIQALIRRCYGGFQNMISVGRLGFDTQTQKLQADGELLSLSPRELTVLEILLLQAGNVVCKDRIAQRLAAEGDAIADNAVEVYIHRVRKRIENYGVIIRTVRGLGYLLEEKK